MENWPDYRMGLGTEIIEQN